MLTPHLTGLTPGAHGFHLHTNGSCEISIKDGKATPAGAAGGHFDPKSTDKHSTPWGDGHLGDLPTLAVDANGNATIPVLAPRLSLADTKGHSLVIHAGGDNYSDSPATLGGGGARVACAVVK